VPAFTSGGEEFGESRRLVHRRGGGRDAFVTEVASGKALLLEGLGYLFFRGLFLLGLSGRV
jgi:hypothetical protein